MLGFENCDVRYVCIKQVVVLIETFVEKNAPDEVVVRAVCTVFNRIVDLEYFGGSLSSSSVSPSLKCEIIHRLGILNVWCSMSPGPIFFG